MTRAPFTPEMVEILRGRYQARSTEQFDFVGPFDRIPKPDSLPIFGWGGEHRIRGLVVAANGSAWLLMYSGVLDQSMKWLVVGADGKVRGQVRADVETEILAIKDSMLLTRRWDVDGVERIEMLTVHLDGPGRDQ